MRDFIESLIEYIIVTVVLIFGIALTLLCNPYFWLGVLLLLILIAK